ncbi:MULTISPECIES: DUF4019 domain-containing protein [unclassified Novosphingobium]|uniref:DUF4019 domain-containing protein n=1 Tax=unclassified Novosphingobium TaxID=2644732 RepID=UPI00146A66C8|nr:MULTISPECIES: DUF4019 domain-containing protein [unclassified Novosphingobium]NMN03857.1 hypothetical protein [Novosphingobium sp. SG919]NMN86153.1 hypothetical protein [Novosphingobium sp. SG916]
MRRLRRRRAFWLLPLLTLSASVGAQTGSAPQKQSAGTVPVAPAQAQPARLSANYFVAQAIQVSEAAASGLLDGVYATASPIMKAAQGKQAFVAQTRDIFNQSGTATARDWVSVRRESVGASTTQGAPPPGDYIVVLLGVETGPQRGRLETVTFHRDSDNQWRLCGFVAAPVGQPAPTTTPKK